MKHIIILLTFVALMVILAVIPNPVKNEATNYGFHITEYIVFSLIFLNICKHYNLKYKYILIMLISSVIAITTEIIQIYVPYRTFNLYDALSGVGGSVLVSLIYFMLEK